MGKQFVSRIRGDGSETEWGPQDMTLASEGEGVMDIEREVAWILLDKSVQMRMGDGVKKSEIFVDVIYGCPQRRRAARGRIFN